MRARPKNLPPSSSRSSNRDESGRERADGGRSHLQVATLYSSRHGGQDRASCQANSRVASAWLVKISSTLRVILCPGDAAVRSKKPAGAGDPGWLWRPGRAPSPGSTRCGTGSRLRSRDLLPRAGRLEGGSGHSSELRPNTPCSNSYTGVPSCESGRTLTDNPL